MEIRITTNQTLMILYVLAWIIFVGVCIEAGGIIFNAFYVLVINPAGAHKFWEGIDLSGLYEYDRGYFFVETLLMSIVAVLRAIMFYFTRGLPVFRYRFIFPDGRWIRRVVC
jgi:hypothetical protein